MAKGLLARTRRDRWADWAVGAVLVVALALGWAVMTYAEGRQEAYTDAGTGLSVRYGRGWLVGEGASNVAFRASDPSSEGFRTTYEVRVWPIDATGATTPTLAAVLSDASLVRAQEGTAYRLFDMQQAKEIDGLPTMEATYAYVVEGSDPFAQRLPVVVEGLDVARAWAGKAYVFSLLADQDAFAQARPAFLKFVETAELQ